VNNGSSALTAPRLANAGRVTQARVARSEWTKLHSLRSTRWSLLIAVVLTIGFPLLFATIRASRKNPQQGHHHTRSRSPCPA
jgi:ABC-2 type transport system permease protein